jgi:UDP-N-acetylmuramoyl-L-alanyl-D-glutamate--2,6-diaminopimelate ligase
MLESIFAAAGIECGVFGTINYRYKNKIINAPNTTPQSADLFLMMREMVDSGIKFLIMEVSSHSLALGRVADIEFDVAIFTNLTQDHLDFHENMDNYFDAKTILFKQLGLLNTKKQKCAIINIDDDYGKKLAQINPQIKTFTYGTKDDDYDFKAENILISNFGSAFDFIVKDKKKERIEIKHIGAHNVYNALASLAAAIFCGVNFDIAVHAIKSAKQAPGRLERIENQGLGFDIFIDYAHTDDALKNVLSALKAINPTRIITVFGCGGDRDRLKRPKMGEVAAQMSDFVFITSDNPRTEDAHKIILDIEVGMKRFKSLAYKVVIDRKEAIAQAVTMCARGDVILIAGKGHEDYQIIGQEKIHFSDFQVASQCLNQRVKKKKTSKTKVMPQGEFDFGNN